MQNPAVLAQFEPSTPQLPSVKICRTKPPARARFGDGLHQEPHAFHQKAWLIFGSGFLFIRALAARAHDITRLEAKFSAAACEARGVLFKNKTDFFLSFRAIFLPVAGKPHTQKLKKWQGKGQRAAVRTILFFFLLLFPFQRPGDGEGWGGGGEKEPHYPAHPARPARREKQSQCHGNGRWHEAGGRAPSPTSGRTALLISSGAGSN